MRDVSRSRFAGTLCVGILATSLAAIFIRMTQAEGVPALSIAAWRLTLASTVLLPFAVATRGQELRRTRPREWLLLAASGIFLGLHFATWIGSLDYTSVASSVVLVSTGPIFVALGSWLFLREPPSKRVLIGLATATLGTVVISSGDLGQGRSQLLGDLLALAGGVAVAGYLIIGRRLRGGRSLIAYVAPVYAAAMVTVLLIALAGRQRMLGFPAVAYGWMLVLALVPQLVGHSSLNWALKYTSATYVGIVTLAEPIASSLMAYVLLGEPITPATFVGGALVLIGVYVATGSRQRASAHQR